MKVKYRTNSKQENRKTNRKTNRKFKSDGNKRSEGLGFKKLSATEVLEAAISSLKP